MEATVMIATLGSLPYDLPPEIIAPVGIPEQAAPRYTFVIRVEDAATDATTIEVGEFDIHFSKLKALATNQSLWPEDAEPPSDFATTWMHAIIQQLQADNLFPTRVVAYEKGRFITGNSGGGRPHGSRAKLGEAFVADLYADWLAHGVATIEKVRTARPADYLKVIASILPKDLNMKVSEIESMTDDEIKASIERLLADVAEREGSEPTEH